MKKLFAKFALLSKKSFVAGFAVATMLLLFINAKKVDSYFEFSKNLEIFTTLFKELDTYYVDPIEPGELVKTGIDEMLNKLDPYTNFITEADIEDYEFQTTGKYGGIGTTMRKIDDKIIVGELYEGTPATKAGLKVGDEVIKIDQQELNGKSIDDVSVLLRGAPKTKVTLLVKHANNKTESISIIRETINISSIPCAALIGKNYDIAYVKLTQFTPNCSRQLKQQLDSLKELKGKLSGLVLDLRNNPGGLLDEAVQICNLFIPKDELVVSTHGKMKDWDKDFKTLEEAWDTELPLTILINENAASASEIVSGTLQDLDRAVVIGERSFGKGLVQTTRPLGYNARLKLTTAKYYTPSGRCIQAIDYTHRKKDGTVSKMADSLKQIFYTKAGRKVWSGGGVNPDIQIKKESYSSFIIALYQQDQFFNFINDWLSKNQNVVINSNYEANDALVNDFSKCLETQHFQYQTPSEEQLDSIKAIGNKEHSFELMKTEWQALYNKLSAAKKNDVGNNKELIKTALEHELIGRYAFTKGKILHYLKKDKDVLKALELLEQPTLITPILHPKK
jgi:carboxyl-terminal processing protease